MGKTVQPPISLDEMKRLLKAKAGGAAVLTIDKQEELIARNKDLEAHNKNLLSIQSNRGRLSPAESRFTLEELCRKHGVQPAEELIKMALENGLDGKPMLTSDQRIKIWAELLSYQMPKLKAVENHSQVDASLTVVVRRFGGDLSPGEERQVKKILEQKVIDVAEDNS